MDECCEVREVPHAQRRVLYAVLSINVGMFLAESVTGLMARSTALLADSADMLGDAIVYGFSLYVVGRHAAWKARAALLKGTVMGLFAVGVLIEVALKLTRELTPVAEIMGVVGALALAANVVCLVLLWRHKGDDINMRSAWVCSRNDVIGNVGVLIASGAVAITGSPWPDILIGFLIAALFGSSAVRVILEARRAGVLPPSMDGPTPPTAS